MKTMMLLPNSNTACGGRNWNKSVTQMGQRFAHFGQNKPRQNIPYGQEFAHFLDPELARAMLAQRLPEVTDITQCLIGHRRYKWYLKPASRLKSSLEVCYHLQVSAQDRTDTQILYARAFLDDRSAKVYQQSCQHPAWAVPRYDTALAHFPDLDMVVWRFPNDPQLSQLGQVSQPEQAAELLPQILSQDNLSDLNIDIINYRPEQRCSMRYTCKHHGKPQVLFAKTFRDSSGKTIQTITEQLWQQSQDDPRAFRVARPRAFDSERHTIWQDYLPGLRLAEYLRQDAWRLIDQISAGLARLHASKPSDFDDLRLPQLSVDEHCAEITKKAAKMMWLIGPHRRRLEALISQLTRRAIYLDNAPHRIIHNDFHGGQLHICGVRLALFDFDELALGDPAQDLANFIIDLHQRLDLEPDLALKLSSHFIHSYSNQSEQPVDIEHLCWYLRLLCLTRAYRLCWQQPPDLSAQVEHLLRLAEAGGQLAGLRW